jgi:hypothetical protein
MYPNHRMTDELAAVEYSIAQVTQRLEVIDATRSDGTGTDDDDRNAQDLQRRYDQLERRRDQLERVLPVPICTMTLTKAEAQALVDAHGIAQRLPDPEEIPLLQENNPDLLQAHTTLELLRRYGKP